MDFEWDGPKAHANERKHGVSFEEASEVFGNPHAFTAPDIAHSLNEERERTVGRSNKGRVLIVISTRRRTVTRIISARGASSAEVKTYEEEVSKKLRGRR